MNDKTNPRYLAYCRAHGKTPEQMEARDGILWPGGSMVGFQLWMAEQKRAFHAANPGAFFDPNKAESIVDFAAWDAWLEQAGSKGVAP